MKPQGYNGELAVMMFLIFGMLFLVWMFTIFVIGANYA